MSEHVQIGANGGVLEILWNRPDKKNALSNAMYTAATEAMLSAAADASIRTVLIGSAGEDFTSGNDLADFAAVAAGRGEARAGRFIETIAGFEKPIVAAVPGLAVGVGATMLLHCDLVYVSETAKLTTPFVNLALTPEAASSILLPARIGHPRAFAMFALGEAVSGPQAAAIGLANACLPVADVLPAARRAARLLAQKPPGAVVATKRLMREGLHVMSRVHEEGAIFGERLKSEEAMEAFTAFGQKRAPDFSRF
jgi:enoyl-CoA hydratase/carnithine racemase